MRRVTWLLLFILVVSPPTLRVDSTVAGPFQEADARSPSSAEAPAAAQVPSMQDAPMQQLERQLEGPLRVEDIAATSTWVTSTGIVDWLGPLAPLALSPFFGVTCLSGLSLWGPEWASQNALLGSTGPLRNQTLFFIFLALTILTSVPRLTKVSKPFAQAVDRVETYAVIVILLVIKLFASVEGSGMGPDVPQVALIQLGILSMTLDTLLAVAMVINILVINSVKFFFEFMVWLTPVPFLDAVFEVCNKTLCAVLMAIYAFSPTLATAINLCMLLLAAIVLRWISRRVRFYRTMMLDPVLSRLWSGFGQPRRPELIVFPKTAFGPFKPLSRLRLRRSDEPGEGWVFEEANWWMPAKTHRMPADLDPQMSRGWIMHCVEFPQEDGTHAVLSFSRRYGGETLQQLADDLGVTMSQVEAEQAPDKIAVEFS